MILVVVFNLSLFDYSILEHQRNNKEEIWKAFKSLLSWSSFVSHTHTHSLTSLFHIIIKIKSFIYISPKKWKIMKKIFRRISWVALLKMWPPIFFSILASSKCGCKLRIVRKRGIFLFVWPFCFNAKQFLRFKIVCLS